VPHAHSPPPPIQPTHATPRNDPATAKAELERRQVQGAVNASDDPGFVRYLSADTLQRGQYAAATACLKRLTALQPDDPNAWRQLGAAAGRVGQWGVSGEAHDRAGRLLLEAALKQGAAGDELAEAGKEFVAGAVAYLNAASVQMGDGGGSGSGGSKRVVVGGSTSKLAHVGRALELLHKAEADAGVADANTWYYTCLGRLATWQLLAALDAATRSWQAVSQQEEGGGEGSGSSGATTSSSSSSSSSTSSSTELKATATKLALPLASLCDKMLASGSSALQQLRAAELAAQVAAAADESGRAKLGAALQRAADAGLQQGEAAERLKALAEEVGGGGSKPL